MKLTHGFEQASCILTLLATQDPAHPISSQVIHHRLNGSQTYLRKIIRKLVVAGLVQSVSGNNGGFTLAKKPEEISLYDVVSATEGEISTYPNTGLIDEVFKDFSPVASEGTKTISAAFAAADSRWREELKSYSVYQLISTTLGNPKIPLVDWNESAEERGLLIQKIIRNMNNH